MPPFGRVSNPGLGLARGDGRQSGRPLRQSEHLMFALCSGPTGRCSRPRSPGNTINHATSYCGQLQAGLCRGRRWSPYRLRRGGSGPGLPFVNVRVVSNRAVFGLADPTTHAGGIPTPRVTPGDVRRRHLVRRCMTSTRRADQAAHRRRTAPDPRGNRSEVVAGQGDDHDCSAFLSPRGRCATRFVPASGWYPTALSAVARRLRTPPTELIGIEHPVVQTGWFAAGARLVSPPPPTRAGILALRPP